MLSRNLSSRPLIKINLRRHRWARIILFSLFIYALVLFLRHENVELGYGLHTGIRSYPRKALSRSPFKIVHDKKSNPSNLREWVSKFRNNGYIYSDAVEEWESLLKWDDLEEDTQVLNRCRLLIASFYQDDMDWSNEQALLTGRPKDSILMIERMRIYDYCFLKGGIDAIDVFDTAYFRRNNLDAWDFQCRMFPFLDRNFDKDHELFLPDVIAISSEGSPMVAPLDIGGEEESPIHFNSNFMKKWIDNSVGKGIVTTTDANQMLLLAKQVEVLDELGNELPIQIVTGGKEVSPEFFHFAERALRGSRQNVYLVDVTRLLDRKFLDDKFQRYMYKWLAVLFNSFEQELLLDVDSVPFLPPRKYFDNERYQQTGLFLYRDRYTAMASSRHRPNLKFSGEPSFEEKVLIGTNLMFESNYTNDQLRTSEGKIYQEFFRFNTQHSVDSGLVPIDKPRKFGGLLLSLLLHLSARYNDVSHGDKELFWLGQLFIGNTYSIGDIEGAAIGVPEVLTKTKNRVGGHSICSCQIGHLGKDNELLWLNGGLRTCKYDQLGVKDFQRNNKYFEEGYGNAETLENFYRSPITIEAAIIPPEGGWQMVSECHNRMMCASLPSEGQTGRKPNDYNGRLIRFGEEDLDNFRKIVRIWNDKTVIL